MGLHVLPKDQDQDQSTCRELKWLTSETKLKTTAQNSLN